MGMRSNTNANHVKAMISRQVDAGRTAYARTVSRRGRRNIFIGTTNEDQPLSDPTGNRRFLPIRVNNAIDTTALFQDVGQLIGEAATLHAEGATFELPKDVWGIAAEYQEGARGMSDLEHYLHDWFGETDFNKQVFVTVADLVRLCDATGRKNTNALVHSTMPRLGFREASAYIDGKKTRVWFRGPDMLPKHIAKLARYTPDTTGNSTRAVLRPALPAPASTTLPAIPGR
jgi:hypothetical protein